VPPFFLRKTPRLGEFQSDAPALLSNERTPLTPVSAPTLSVEDEGPGITEVERERVLECFYRIAGTPRSGCGLGLAIAQEIARAHGATLEITQPKARKFNCTPAVSLGLAATVHRRFHAESH
jgi:Histidine kinase-, DNA gyrase B-, and HSP90-like ATPase